MPKFDGSKFKLQQFYYIFQCDNRIFYEPDSRNRDMPIRRRLKFIATNECPLATQKQVLMINGK